MNILDNLVQSFGYDAAAKAETLKAKIQEAKDKDLSIRHIGDYERMAPSINNFLSHIFSGLKSKSMIYIAIDSKLNAELIHIMDFASLDTPRLYRHFKTGEEESDDCQIVSALTITDLFTLEEIFTTAAFLIYEDVCNKGLLKEIAKDEERNLNIGYYERRGMIYVVYIERFEPKEGREHAYHLHESLAPRVYLPHRHMLIR